MKYIKQPKRHIVPDDFEWRHLLKVSMNTASKSSTRTAVLKMNSIRDRVNEIVLNELINQ